MPSPKRQLRSQRQFTAFHCRQLDLGADPNKQAWGSLAPDSRRGRFRLLADIPPGVLAEMAACWQIHGGAIEKEHIERAPGSRPWFAWVAALLPTEPRHRVEPADEDFADCGEHPPAARPWRQDGGHESGLAYLHRRKLLLPTEITALRPLVGDALAFSRQYAPSGASVFEPGELATIRQLWPDLLTDDEIERAAAWESAQ